MTPAPDRNALLSSIQKGAKLKKAVTNDRSAPLIDGNAKGGAPSAGSRGDGPRATSTAGGPAAPAAAGPMGLGGLFAGGMPKLRSTGARLVSSNGMGLSLAGPAYVALDDVSSSSKPKDPAATTVSPPTAPNGSPQRRSAETMRDREPPKVNLFNRPPHTSAATATATASRQPPQPPPPSGLPPRRDGPGKKSFVDTSAAARDTQSAPRDFSPERRVTAPVVRPPSLPDRPSLPSRPAPVISKLQGLKINDNSSSLKPRHASAAELPQRENGGVRACWKFPPEASLPRPTTPHSGRVFVYPSGREQGSYINEAADEPSAAVNGVAGTLRRTEESPSKTAPPPPIVHRQPPASTLPAGSKAASTESATDFLQAKLSRLESNLDAAIARQDFEVCLELKPRITKLKDMLELAQRGLAIDRAKIDAV